MNHMALHPDKTKFMLITPRQKRQNIVSYFHPLTVQGVTIEEVQNHRVLGVITDNNLSWTPHVNSLCKKISIKTFQLSTIKHFVNFHARKILFHAHIQSLIDYGFTLWDSASKNCLKPLRNLYKRSLKLSLLKRSTLEQDDFNLLNILPLHAKLKYKGIYMQKIISGNAPPSVTRFSQLTPPENKLRSIFRSLKSSLTFSGASLWNSLPLAIKSRSNYSFKKHYLSYLTSIS